MSLSTLLIAAALAVVVPQPSPLIGVWEEIDGPGAARIEACGKAGQLCAVGLARRADGVGRVDDGVVLKGVEAAGRNHWRGTFIDGSRTLQATLRLTRADVVEMRVCLLLFCQTARYRRA